MSDEELQRVYREAYRAAPDDKAMPWTDEAVDADKARRHVAGLRAVAEAALAEKVGAKP